MRSVRHWRHFRWVRDLGLMLLVVMGVRAYQQRDVPDGMAPAIEGRDIHGKSVSLANYRGRPLLLHFWATWCGVCEAEQDHIDALARGLPVLTVASQSGTVSDVVAYASRHRITAPVMADGSGALAARFGVRAFPTTIILDGLGVIRHVEVGYTTELGLRFRMWLATL